MRIRTIPVQPAACMTARAMQGIHKPRMQVCAWNFDISMFIRPQHAGHWPAIAQGSPHHRRETMKVASAQASIVRVRLPASPQGKQRNRITAGFFGTLMFGPHQRRATMKTASTQVSIVNFCLPASSQGKQGSRIIAGFRNTFS